MNILIYILSPGDEGYAHKLVIMSSLSKDLCRPPWCRAWRKSSGLAAATSCSVYTRDLLKRFDYGILYIQKVLSNFHSILIIYEWTSKQTVKQKSCTFLVFWLRYPMSIHVWFSSCPVQIWLRTIFVSVFCLDDWTEWWNGSFCDFSGLGIQYYFVTFGWWLCRYLSADFDADDVKTQSYTWLSQTNRHSWCMWWLVEEVGEQEFYYCKARAVAHFYEWK